MVRITRLLGIDRAIFYVLLGRLWLVGAGILNLFVIGLWLSPVEQGYYYTFSSLTAAQVFFELGLTSVIMQFASHEHAAVVAAQGSAAAAVAKARLASLVRLALRWYGVAAVLFAGGLGAVGYNVLNRGGEPVPHWQSIWLANVVVAACLLAISPLFAILEGCGRYAEVAGLRVAQSVVAHVALWLTFIAGWGLVGAVAFALASLIVAGAWLWKVHGSFFTDLWGAARATEAIQWRTEVFPYQWRLAISYASGYFIGQLFTPILFTYHGAAEAGRMGMSIAVTGAVTTLSLAWITTKAPTFGLLVAQERFSELNLLFAGALRRTLFVCASAAVVLVGAVIALNIWHVPVTTRLLPPLSFTLLILSSVVNVVLTAMAVYLRSFKREPFLMVSLANAAFIAPSTYFLGRAYGATGMTAGYLAINAGIGLTLGWSVFIRKRRLWTLSAANEK